MKRSLVVHVGDFKTGSTSIQAALAARRGQGDICYPGRRNDHIHLAQMIRKAPDAPASRRAFAAIAREIGRSGAAFAVLSAEHFQMVGPLRLRDWIAEFLPDHLGDLRVVYYVRPHAEFILSTYAEQVKLGVCKSSLPEFVSDLLARNRMRYRPRLNRWARTFDGRFVARAMVRDHLVQGDAVADFYATVTGRVPGDLRPEATLNRSLPVEDLAFLRALHIHLAKVRSDVSESDRNAFGNALQSELAKIPFPEAHPLRFDREQRDLVLGACRTDAKRTDRIFFEGTPMTDALEGSERLIGTVPPKGPLLRRRHAVALARMNDPLARFLTSGRGAMPGLPVP